MAEEAKMLNKLIAVNSNHFITYKCKILLCLHSPLKHYLSIYQWLFLIMKTFDQWSARGANWCRNFYQYKQMASKLKNAYTTRFVTFYLVVLLSVGIWSYFTEGDVCRKMRWMYLSIVEKYFCIEVMHNLGITLMNNTSPKSFPVNFIHYKYCF